MITSFLSGFGMGAIFFGMSGSFGNSSTLFSSIISNVRSINRDKNSREFFSLMGFADQICVTLENATLYFNAPFNVVAYFKSEPALKSKVAN